MELVELVGGVADGETYMVTAGILELVIPRAASLVGPFTKIRYVRTGRRTADGYRCIYELAREARRVPG